MEGAHCCGFDFHDGHGVVFLFLQLSGTPFPEFVQLFLNISFVPQSSLMMFDTGSVVLEPYFANIAKFLWNRLPILGPKS